MKKKLIPIKELSEYIGVPTTTLYAWVSMQKIPFIKFNGRTLFDVIEIDEMIEAGRGKIKKRKRKVLGEL